MGGEQDICHPGLSPADPTAQPSPRTFIPQPLAPVHLLPTSNSLLYYSLSLSLPILLPSSPIHPPLSSPSSSPLLNSSPLAQPLPLLPLLYSPLYSLPLYPLEPGHSESQFSPCTPRFLSHSIWVLQANFCPPDIVDWLLGSGYIRGLLLSPL